MCRRPDKSDVKSFGSTERLRLKLSGLRIGEESGTAGVGVKSLDIGRNTIGEGGSLDDS